MSQHLTEFEVISKAIQSSYKLLQSDNSASQLAIERLQEAEISLNKALGHVLSQSET